jgi:hypothetical protein
VRADGQPAPFTYRITHRESGGRYGEGSDAQQQRKEKTKQDKNKKKRGEAPSTFAVKLGTSYMSQYGKKH